MSLYINSIEGIIYNIISKGIFNHTELFEFVLAGFLCLPPQTHAYTNEGIFHFSFYIDTLKKIANEYKYFTRNLQDERFVLDLLTN